VEPGLIVLILSQLKISQRLTRAGGGIGIRIEDDVLDLPPQGHGSSNCCKTVADEVILKTWECLANPRVL